uniref:DNA-directed RNA polymerase iii complex subunit rpc37 n=1 Tax=Colletotrichum fructicola (strain Nara gc5) TaxID=1213859 RepID=L2FEQ6_COLFN
MADRLRSVQIEPWRKLKYTDENDEAAWEIYQESLILRAPGDNKLPPAEEDEEKKKAAIEAGEAETKPTVDLAESMARLETTWGDDELLEAVSGIKKPKPARGAVGSRRGGKARAAPAQASSSMDLT